jgi:hypothetical protein
MEMINLKSAAAALILGFAVAGAVASPAPAQTSQERTLRPTVTQPGHPARAQAGGEFGGITQRRADAIRACSARANRYLQHTYGNMQSYAYRSCMMEHGEPD